MCPQLGGLWKDLGLQTLVQTGGLGCESRGAGLGQVDRKLAQWSGAWRLRHAGDLEVCEEVSVAPGAAACRAGCVAMQGIEVGGFWDSGCSLCAVRGGVGAKLLLVPRGSGRGTHRETLDPQDAVSSQGPRVAWPEDSTHSQICGKPLAPSLSLFICEMEISSLNLQAVPEGDAIRKGGGQGSHSRSLAGVSISWTRSQLRAPGPATCVQVCTVPTRPTRPQTAPHISDPTLAQDLRGVGAHSREGVVTLGWWGGCHGKGQ